jgi:hypothetical protein
MIVRGLESAIQWSIKRRRSILRERARCDTVAACEATECTRVVLPPRLLFDELLGRFMSHSAYNRYIRPTIADMHHEYFQCLANKDKRGARWAVIRGHMYVIPSWVWLCLMRAFERVLAK